MRKKDGQTILEYAILIALVVGVLLIMQTFVKRGYQGSLKASADRMGEQFSTSGETIKVEQAQVGDQLSHTEILTKPGVYSWHTNESGETTAVTQNKIESLSNEKTRANDFSSDSVSGKLTDPDLP